MAQKEKQTQQQQQRWWWQQDDICGVSPQQTGISQASALSRARDDQLEEKRPPLPPRPSQSSLKKQWQQDDIYGVTPQHTGVTSHHTGASQRTHRTHASRPRTRDGGFEPRGGHPYEEEKAPPLPPRRSTSSFQHDRPSSAPSHAPPLPPPALGQMTSASASNPHGPPKEHVVAYMIPLPQPLGPNGLPLAVPQRYMLYLPPAPDLLKPDPPTDNISPSDQAADGKHDGATNAAAKERSRDKARRKWQAEVRKAKTYSGAVVSVRGLYSASVRGAVYVLSLLQRSELTFLSRLPRRTLRELELMHPGSSSAGDEERFAEVRAEFERNRRLARRDFWIATALLPFATTIDLLIPIFGGLSEVDLVWMAVNGRAWLAARGVTKRMILAPGAASRALQDGGRGSGGSTSGYEADGTPPEMCAGANGGHEHSDDDEDEIHGHNFHSRPGPDDSTERLGADNQLFDEDEDHDLHNSNGASDEKARNKRREARQKKAKQDTDKQPVEMSFRPSTSMMLLTRYIQAACHTRNPRAFADPATADAPAPEEADVLRSIGWAPQTEGRRRADWTDEDVEADIAWQVRKTSEDLRAASARAAKTWDKQCKRFMAAAAVGEEKGSSGASGHVGGGGGGDHSRKQEAAASRAQWRKKLFDDDHEQEK